MKSIDRKPTYVIVDDQGRHYFAYSPADAQHVRDTVGGMVYPYPSEFFPAPEPVVSDEVKQQREVNAVYESLLAALKRGAYPVEKAVLAQRLLGFAATGAPAPTALASALMGVGLKANLSDDGVWAVLRPLLRAIEAGARP